ncbi:MAG: hypothetical protein RL154_184 [Pseudomonadota bacterium]|jgi:molybdate transport system regulatory protein
MKTSARNQLNGKITKVSIGAVNSEIEIDASGVKVVAVITNESAASLGFKSGDSAYAIIKASAIILSATKPAKISARNVIAAKISEIKEGAVNSEVKLLAGAQELVAIVTNDAVKDLALATGKEAFAIFKASSVIVGA